MLLHVACLMALPVSQSWLHDVFHSVWRDSQKSIILGRRVGEILVHYKELLVYSCFHCLYAVFACSVVNSGHLSNMLPEHLNKERDCRLVTVSSIDNGRVVLCVCFAVCATHDLQLSCGRKKHIQSDSKHQNVWNIMKSNCFPWRQTVATLVA